MIFLNEKTGLKWIVTDESMIKRLSSSKDYTVVPEKKKPGRPPKAKEEDEE